MDSLTRVTAGSEGLDTIATAIARLLRRRPLPAVDMEPGTTLVPADGEVPGAVLVSGLSRRTPRGGTVVAAVDDDTGRHRVVRFAAAQADRLGVPLRAVHVWGERGSARTTRYHRLAEADLLLSEVLDDHETAEREILHDPDVVRALTALSGDVALIVVTARTRPAVAGEPLGETVRGLAGSTVCPLAVLSSGVHHY